MILRNKKEIPHGPSRGLPRDPVVCEDIIDGLPRDDSPQASTEKKVTVQEGGCGNSNLGFLELANSQATNFSTIHCAQGKTSSSSSSSSSSSFIFFHLQLTNENDKLQHVNFFERKRHDVKHVLI